MVDYYNVTTNTGDAEIAAAIASNTKLAITHIAFGDGNGAVPNPSKTRTTLVHEVHRQAVTKYERHPTNANWLVIETIIPSNIGGFWVREMGVIANGKLISHGSHAPFEKVADPTGVSEYRLKFTQNITDGSVVEITLDESLIFASQAWVEENFIKCSEIVDNLTTDDATKPISAKQAKNLQDNKLGKDATAATAEKLATKRIIDFSGAVTGSFQYDGSGDGSCILTLANSGVAASTYGSKLKVPVLTVNAKGLITGVSEQTIPEVLDASTEQKGIVQIATTSEVKAGQLSSKVVTPKSLKESYENSLKKYGYSIRPDGLIEQWGLSSVVYDGSSIYITFPINFPTECFNIQATENKMSTSSTAAAHVAAVGETNQGFNLHYNSSANTNTIAFWRAIGK